MNKLEELQRLLCEGRIGRRDFIKQTAALGVAGAIPGLVLTNAAEAAAPKHGGRLRQGLRGGNIADTLFGVLGLGDSHQVNTQWQLLSNLTEVTADGNIAGELAESWESSADASIWAFKLRKGVEFHNGKSFGADDVVHSINVHRGDDSKSTGKGLISGITDVKADGKHTVIFVLSGGNADFPFTLSDYHFPIAPAGSTDADWEKGIGTGPYVLSEWDPGVRSATTRNPNYFKEGRPYFDEVESLHISDTSARINALRTGVVDVIDEPDIKTLHLLEADPKVVIHEVGGNKHYTFPMRMDLAPFDNNDVRLAVKYGVDRQQMLDRILRGHGYLGNDHPIGKNQRFFASDLPQREFDPDKAKFHLKKAGLASLDIELHAADIYTGGLDAAVLYKEQAAKAGINISLKQAPTDGYWNEVWNTVPFCVSFWSGRATEDLMFSLAFAADSGWNETHWNNERFEKLLVAARGELDVAKRRQMYADMQELVRNEGGLVAPVFANFVTAATPKVQVPKQLSSTYVCDGYKGTERWWFA